MVVVDQANYIEEKERFCWAAEGVLVQWCSVDSLANFQAPDSLLVVRFRAASGLSYQRAPVAWSLIRSELHSPTELVLTTPRPQPRHTLYHFLHFSKPPLLHRQDHVTLVFSTHGHPTYHGACCRLELLLDPGLDSRAVDLSQSLAHYPRHR